ncbi:MoaD/ThiS family protein [Candidatus Bathyarchaeota archaeon]|jgi:MoaD family protein|nr:MoaD/ThiS family protein [Candidatus Bathyarchaeota archaeon]
MAKVRLFGRVSDAAQGHKELKISSKTLGELLEHLKRTYGDQFTSLIFDETGKIKPFINVFINKKHMSQFKGLDVAINDEDEVLIVPAIAGG